MRRSAKLLCAFGLIEILCTPLALFIFGHIPYPWGGGASAKAVIDNDWTWQLDVEIAILAMGIMGIIFVLGSGFIYMGSRLKTSDTNSIQNTVK
jgi:biotin transporter BioY